MTRRRRVALAVAALAVVSLVGATAGFTSVTADRAASVAVVPDDEAYLGVAVERTADDVTAISFVGFCVPPGSDGDTEGVAPTATVTAYKPEGEPRDEALAVEWTTDEPVSTVVLKTGGGPDAVETFDADATTGTATVGEGDRPGTLSASDYCPDGEREAGKLEAPAGLDVAADATPVGAVRVTLTNQFAESLTTVEVTAGDTTRDLADADRTELGVGESVTYLLPATCESVAVEARGEDTTVSLDRECP